MRTVQLNAAAASANRLITQNHFLKRAYGRAEYFEAIDFDKVNPVQIVTEIKMQYLDKYLGKNHAKVCVTIDCERCIRDMTERSRKRIMGSRLRVSF
ncbi:hypothetical protein LTR22_004622 [Elasticomyces elasticus]|nr:hypothetical protein LTR22_004622 [Elasticomyces elasticus]